MQEKIDFLGVRIDKVNTQEVISRISQYALSEGKKVITYLNAHCFNLSVKDNHYRDLLNLAHMILADGYGILFATKILKTPLPQRVNNADFFELFCKKAREDDLSLYLLGGDAKAIDKTVSNLKNRFPGLKIKGASNGYFNGEKEKKIIDEINRAKPDILIVGLGVPQQEKWIYRNLERLDVKVFWAVGGLFNLLSGRLTRAPRWMIRMGLEWLYRLIQEPKRLWRRYLIGNIIFAYYILIEIYVKFIKPKIYKINKRYYNFL